MKKKKLNLVKRIKFFLKNEFWENKIITSGLIIAFIINLMNWGALKIWVRPVDLPIVLHYNVYFGVDILGDWQRVFFSPILAIILFGFNILLSLFFYNKKERVASYIIILGNLMLQICFLIYSVSLIIINY